MSSRSQVGAAVLWSVSKVGGREFVGQKILAGGDEDV